MESGAYQDKVGVADQWVGLLTQMLYSLIGLAVNSQSGVNHFD